MKYSTEERWLLLRFLARASFGYARSSIKNCVKFLIGRKTYYNDHDLFFRQYVFHVTRIRRITRITCPGLIGEGPGSQALMLMHAISFARASGLDYVHTPFSCIAHANGREEEWSSVWEQLFNLGAGEVPCEAPRHKVVSYCHNFPDLELCFGWHSRRDDLTAHFRASLTDFRRKFYLVNPKRITAEVTVAVHIRRGEVSASRYNHLFTSTETTLRTLADAVSILDARGMKYKVSVYSEGNAVDLAEVALPGVELSRYRIGPYSAGNSIDPAGTTPSAPNGAAFIEIAGSRAMRELIEADVLIMAKSSFSYYAAYISDGIKIFEPYAVPLDDWILRSPDGSFDRAAFERQLFLLLQAKALAASNTTDP